MKDRAGIKVDEETLKPEHNPETLESNVPALYLASSVVSGRETSRIFIENGRFHGDMIVRAVVAMPGGPKILRNTRWLGT